MDKLGNNPLSCTFGEPQKIGLRLSLANPVNLRLLIGAILLLLIIHGFNAFFTLGTLNDLTEKSIFSSYLTINNDKIVQFQSAAYYANLKIIAIALVSGITLLVIGVSRIPIAPEDNSFPKKAATLVILLSITLTQIISSGLSFLTFNNYQSQIAKEKSITLNQYLKEKTENFLKKNRRISQQDIIEIIPITVFESIPEIENAALLVDGEEPVFLLSKDLESFSISEVTSSYSTRLNLLHNGAKIGSVVTFFSKDALSKKLSEIILNSITIIAISFLFLAEILILLFKYIDKYIEKLGLSKRKTPIIHYSLARPAIFLFLFGVDISMAFLPLHMETLYKPLLGLPKDVILGLPISVEFFFVGVAIFISGAWLDRRGWHEPFLFGLVLVGIGGLYSWLATDAIHFIVSRGIIGIGYGLTLMALQGFVIAYTDGKNKAQGLAYLIAGLYAGSICGTAIGAILAERVGYSMVFLIGALIVFLVFLYTFIFMRTAFNKPITESKPGLLKPNKNKKFIKFITNRTVLSLIFFSSLPTAIAAIGFLNYFSPIYLNRLGASESTIGRILMVYGVCLIYIGPFISKYIDAAENKRAYIFLGCLFGSCAFLVFNVLGGFTAAIIAVFLLGLSNCLVLASQSAYTLSLEVTREFGEGKSIGIFRATSRIGQMLGPVIFSSIILTTNINQGITYLGLLFLLTALLFLLLTQPNKQTVARANN